MGKLDTPGRPWNLRPRSIQQVLAVVALGGLALVMTRPQPQRRAFVPPIATTEVRRLIATGNLDGNASIDPRFVHSAPDGIDDAIIVAPPRIDDGIVAPR